MDDAGGRSDSIESPTSWIIASVALAVLTISYGAPLITVVALKPIAAEFGTPRSAPALAVSLTYIGSGIGGIAMGWLAGRIGLRRVAMSCGTMIAAGLVLASFGGLYQLYTSNLLLIGLLGASGMFSPMMAYVTRWFDRHRGSAIALVSSGQYVAGAVWPLLFQVGVDAFGWRLTMRGLCDRGRRYDLAAGRMVLPSSARTGRREGRRRRAWDICALAAVTPEPDDGIIDRSNFLLLRDDVDTAGTYRRLLRRYRDWREAGRRDAVVATRRRRRRTATLGLGC